MTAEEKAVERLVSAVPFLEGKLTVTAEKRIFCSSLDRNQFNRLVKFLKEDGDFFRAHHVVGIDEKENLTFMYIFSNADYVMLAVKESVRRSNPEIDSAAVLFPAFLIHELELVDLFGAVIDGLPDMPHYPLPDGWPKGNYPMRKDWNPAYFDKETMTYNPPETDRGEG